MDRPVTEGLIARLATAIEGSRSMDRAIGVAIDAEQSWSGDATGLGYAAYTTSLDAAMTLRPAGHEAVIGTFSDTHPDDDGDPKAERRPWANVFAKPRGAWNYVYAATPALALCIACLKARVRNAAPPVLPVRSE